MCNKNLIVSGLLIVVMVVAMVFVISNKSGCEEGMAEVPTLAQESPDVVLAQSKSLIELYLKKAQEYKRKGEYEAALDEARRAVEIEPNDLRSYTMAGGLCMELGRFEEAVDIDRKYIKLLEEGNNLGWFEIMRHVWFLKCARQYDEAVEFLKKHRDVSAQKTDDLIRRVEEDKAKPDKSFFPCDGL